MLAVARVGGLAKFSIPMQVTTSSPPFILRAPGCSVGPVGVLRELARTAPLKFPENAYIIARLKPVAVIVNVCEDETVGLTQYAIVVRVLNVPPVPE
jgi:hypothetical protein